MPNPHVLALVLPLTTFSFLCTAPHGALAALAWTLPFWLLLAADFASHQRRRPAVDPAMPGRFYDGLLYSLAIVQWLNVGLMLMRVSQLPWQTTQQVFDGLVNLIVIRFLVGTSSGTSGIVIAHELIHRSERHMQWLGRLLLYTVGYEHFTITHMSGHHRTAGLPDDIAAARLNENFNAYWRRIYPGHLRYAWRCEQERLGLAARRITTRRLAAETFLRNRVLRGLMIEGGLLLMILFYFGWLAALMFIIQARSAVRILEAVNYFQHWGLQDKRYARSFGWVSDSAISRFALIGLSHHIGHHENEQTPFYRIAYSDQGPKMPYGYFVMNLWVKLNNDSYRRMAIGELERYRTAKIKPPACGSPASG